MKTKKRNFFIVSALGIMFMLPGIFAYEFFTHPSWLSRNTINKGELLSPETIQLPKTTANWRLILWYPQSCQDDCVKKIDVLARIRLALGRHLYEVESLVLVPNESDVSKELRKRFDENDIHVSSLPLSQLNSRYLMSVPQVFIANSSNYLILSYDLDAKSEDIFHDIQQLIRISRTSK